MVHMFAYADPYKTATKTHIIQKQKTNVRIHKTNTGQALDYPDRQYFVQDTLYKVQLCSFKLPYSALQSWNYSSCKKALIHLLWNSMGYLVSPPNPPLSKIIVLEALLTRLFLPARYPSLL